MSAPTVAQIRPLSPRPTPAEVAEFSRAVRSALLGLQVVPGQLAQLQRQLTGVAAVAGAGAVVEAPTLPTDFTATPLFSGIQLAWAPPGYEGHAYTEIWRAQVDDLGQAVLVDREAFLLWTDTALPSSALAERYYYWIRHVNDNGDAGAFNATAGTAASTVDDPEYLLEIATEKWLPVNNYALGALTIPTRPNGFCYEVTTDGGSSGAVEPAWPVVIGQTVADGGLVWTCKAAFSFETFFKVALVDGVPRLTLSELFLADLVVKRGMIGDLAVDDAKIDNLSVTKLLAGIIQASNIFLGAESRVHLDGQNNRIVVTDAGGVTRVVLGKLAAGYGIEIYDAAGGLILGSGGQYGAAIANSAVPVGGNVVTNFFNAQTWGEWGFDNASGQSAIGFDLGGWFVTGAPPHTGYIVQAGSVQTEDYLYSHNFPVVPGETYGFSLYTGSHRAVCRIWINWLNSASTWVGQTSADVNDDAQSGGTTLAGYKRLFSYGTAPAGAVFAQLLIVKGPTKVSTNSYFFFTRPQFSRINTGQTVPPMWVPGPQIAGQGVFATAPQLTAANISTYIAGAAIGNAQIGNAAVGTLTIQGNAVTVPAAFEAAQSQNLGAPISHNLNNTDFAWRYLNWQSLSDLPLTTLGSPIHATWGFTSTSSTIPPIAYTLILGSGHSVKFQLGIQVRILINGVEPPDAYLADLEGIVHEVFGPSTNTTTIALPEMKIVQKLLNVPGVSTSIITMQARVKYRSLGVLHVAYNNDIRVSSLTFTTCAGRILALGVKR